MESIVRRIPPESSRRCAFTGYRPQKLPFGFNEDDPRCRELKERLLSAIEEIAGEGYTYFISGGALGMDMYAAEAVLELKKEMPALYLEMVSPFDNQSARWAPEYRLRHTRLFACADRITVTGHCYSKECMLRRNRYLVDNCDLLLACYDGRSGGTAMTVDYALRAGVPVRYIRPARSSVSDISSRNGSLTDTWPVGQDMFGRLPDAF